MDASRRTLLGAVALATLPSIAVAASATHPDAHLLALGERWRPIRATWDRAAQEEEDAKNLHMDAGWPKSGVLHERSLAAMNLAGDAEEALTQAEDAIRAATATTLAGFAVKAEALLAGMWERDSEECDLLAAIVAAGRGGR